MKNNETKKVIIYTDGSCLGNPGPGGWGVIVKQNSRENILRGGASDTTNNRMEMTAVLEALKWIKNNPAAKDVEIYSDSSLLVNSIKKGWKRKKNTDLWIEIDELNSELNKKGVKIEWHWVKGHADNHFNEKADRTAVKEAKKQQEKSPVKRKTLKKSPLYFCPKCKKETKGVLSYMPDSQMIRVDCSKCGSYIMFGEKTTENLKKAKKNVLISKKQAEKVKEIMKKRGEEIPEKDLKKWTKEKAGKFIKGDQTLF